MFTGVFVRVAIMTKHLVLLVVVLLAAQSYVFAASSMSQACAAKQSDCKTRCGAGTSMDFKCDDSNGNFASSCACSRSSGTAAHTATNSQQQQAPPSPSPGGAPTQLQETCSQRKQSCSSSCPSGTKAVFQCDEKSTSSAKSIASACTCVPTTTNSTWSPSTEQGVSSGAQNTTAPFVTSPEPVTSASVSTTGQGNSPSSSSTSNLEGYLAGSATNGANLSEAPRTSVIYVLCSSFSVALMMSPWLLMA